MTSVVNRELYTGISEFAMSGKRGETSYDSTNAPFFLQGASKHNEPGRKLTQTNERLTSIESTMKETQGFPQKLKMLYQIIADPSIEFYIDNWTLFPLNKIYDRRLQMLTDGQTRVIDFGLLYAGMGHVIIAAFDVKDKMIFYRHDGGSNGWDRAENAKYAKDFNPETDKCLECKMTIEEWIDDVTNKKRAFDLNVVNEF